MQKHRKSVISKRGVSAIFQYALFCAILSTLLLFAGKADALLFELEPANTNIAVGSEVIVKVYVNGATSLISMGVKVEFDPAFLEVTSASKNIDFSEGWIMDADGLSSTDDDQYATPAVEIDTDSGSVTMIGGRIIGTTAHSLSGKVLLGEITFKGIADGQSALHIDLAKYHPDDPTDTYDNFVNLDKTIDEPTNARTDLGNICVKVAGDVTGDGWVNVLDLNQIRDNFMQNGSPGWLDADLNRDGWVNVLDLNLVRDNFMSSGGRVCP
jgi:hypothetical protein